MAAVTLVVLCVCLRSWPVPSEADAWLNDPEVREALHAAPSERIGPWTICSDRITYTANGGSMLPIHKQLTRARGAACCSSEE